MKTRLTISMTLGVACLVGMLIAGCTSTPTADPDPKMLSTSAATGKEKKPVGRAQLWTDTCNRCHNSRSPDSYSANEWGIIMTHMRLRGYLTGEDQRAIQEFLQSQ